MTINNDSININTLRQNREAAIAEFEATLSGILVPNPYYAEDDLQFIGEEQTPYEFKAMCVKIIFDNFSLCEMLGIIRTIEGWEDLKFYEIKEYIVDGAINPDLESPEARELHARINSALVPLFVYGVQKQGVEMDEDTARTLDILREDWDYRPKEQREEVMEAKDL